MSQPRAIMPHCDSSILHAPGVCKYCDDYPDYQEARSLQRINFTDEYDPRKTPCPSEYFRSADTRNKWHGNVAKQK